MRPFRALAIVVLSFHIVLAPAIHSSLLLSATHDPQAFSVLQQAVAVMGLLPSDSSATGTIILTAGSKKATGTVRILTRGTNQTRTDIQTSDSSQSVVYSAGVASQQVGTTPTSLPLELTVTSQAAHFPLPLMVAWLSNSDFSLQYVALETVDGRTLHHLRVSNTFSSVPKLRALAEFSKQDIWLDAASNLPARFSYTQRSAGGAASRIPVEITYDDYRKIDGILYPFQLKESLNGTPWAVITIDSVTFNSGLTDTNFPVQ